MSVIRDLAVFVILLALLFVGMLLAIRWQIQNTQFRLPAA